MLARVTRLARVATPGSMHRVAVAAPVVSISRQIGRRPYSEDHSPNGKIEALGDSQSWKISQAIQNDRVQLQECYDHIVKSKDTEEQIRYQNAFIWELARHSISKELVVYPALEKEVAGGADIAAKARAKHQSIKEQLYEFQKLKPGDSAFTPTLEKLYQDLEQHFKEEEEQDLAKLEEKLGMTASKELSQTFERTKAFTPTRAHPGLPNKPPFETVAGLMAAPIDKLRDLFSKFPESKMPEITKEPEGGYGKAAEPKD